MTKYYVILSVAEGSPPAHPQTQQPLTDSGKFRLEHKLVKTPAILYSLNWLRRKAKRPPLVM